MSEELTIVDQMQLANLPAAVQQLNELHAQVNDALDRAWKTGVVIGMQLCRLKAALPHGEFGKLFADANSQSIANLSFKQRQANNYMKLYNECLNAAGRLERGEAVAALLEDYRAAYALGHDRKGELMRRHATRALSRELTALAPEAHYMQQALMAFMGQPMEKPAPNFTERNMKGRVKKEVDDAALRESVTQELDTLRGQLDELMDSGRFTLATAECRAAFEVSLKAFINKLKEVR